MHCPGLLLFHATGQLSPRHVRGESSLAACLERGYRKRTLRGRSTRPKRGVLEFGSAVHTDLWAKHHLILDGELCLPWIVVRGARATPPELDLSARGDGIADDARHRLHDAGIVGGDSSVLHARATGLADLRSFEQGCHAWHWVSLLSVLHNL